MSGGNQTLEGIIRTVAEAVQAGDYPPGNKTTETSKPTGGPRENLYAQDQHSHWASVIGNIDALVNTLAEGEVSAAVLTCRRRANELVPQQREILIRMCDDVLRFRKRLVRNLEDWEDGGGSRGGGGERGEDRYGRAPLQGHQSNHPPPGQHQQGGPIGFGEETVEDSNPEVCAADRYLAPFHRFMKRALAEDATKCTWQIAFKRPQTAAVNREGGSVSKDRGIDASALVFQLPAIEPMCAPLGVPLYTINVADAGAVGGEVTTVVSTRVAADPYPADDSGAPGNFQGGGYSTAAKVVVLPHLLRPSVAATARREWLRQQRALGDHKGGASAFGRSGHFEVEAASDISFDEIHMMLQLKHMLHACQTHGGAKKVLSLESIETCATALATMIALYDLTNSTESKFAAAKDAVPKSALETLRGTALEKAHSATAEPRYFGRSSTTTVGCRLGAPLIDAVLIADGLTSLLMPHPFADLQSSATSIDGDKHHEAHWRNSLMAHAIAVSKPFSDVSRQAEGKDPRVEISEAVLPFLRIYHSSMISLCFLDNTTWAVAWRYAEQARKWFCGDATRGSGGGLTVSESHRMNVLKGIDSARLPMPVLGFMAEQGLL